MTGEFDDAISPWSLISVLELDGGYYIIFLVEMGRVEGRFKIQAYSLPKSDEHVSSSARTRVGAGSACDGPVGPSRLLVCTW